MSQLKKKLSKLSKIIVKYRLKIDKNSKKEYMFFAKGKSHKIAFNPTDKTVNFYFAEQENGFMGEFKPVKNDEEIIAIGSRQEEMLKFFKK